MKLSDKIEFVLHVMEQCQADVRWYTQQQEDAEKEQTNLNHELEGVGTENRQPPNYDERARIATKLQHNLIRRRVAKDSLRANQPLLRFIESDEGKRAMNKLQQTLGELRNVEQTMDARAYLKRETVAPETNPEMSKNLNKLIKDWKKSKKKHS